MNRPFIQYLLLAAILVAGAGFFADVKNTGLYGGVDLRNRVTAARVASELHKDPYTYKWSPSDSDRYLDPADNITIPYARVTVPPTVLLFQNIISPLPYQTQRWIWFTFQWAALIASLALLGRCVRQIPRPAGTPFMKEGINNEMLVWIFGLFFIAGSSFWRLHVERGQIYIWYVLLFSAALYLYKRGENKSLTASGPLPLGKGEKSSAFYVAASGLVLGYLVSLRPPFVFAVIPFLFYKKFKFVSFVAGGALISVFLTGLFFPLSLWKSYYASTSFQGAMRAFPDIHYESPGVDVAEGMNIVNFLNVSGEDSSLQRIVHAITDTWLGGAALAVLLIATIALLIFFIYRSQNWIPAFPPSPKASDGRSAGMTDNIFLTGITFTMISELFIPAPRWPYADVIWLIPIALLIQKLNIVKHDVIPGLDPESSSSVLDSRLRGNDKKHDILRNIVLTMALAGLMLNTGLHGVAKLALLGEYLFIGGLMLTLLLNRHPSPSAVPSPLSFRA